MNNSLSQEKISEKQEQIEQETNKENGKIDLILKSEIQGSQEMTFEPFLIQFMSDIHLEFPDVFEKFPAFEGFH